MSTTTIRLPAEWKAPLLQLRDNLPEAQAQELIATLACRTPEQITALLQAIHQPVAPEAPAATVAKIRADSNAELPRRRPSEPKPLEEGKILIVLKNDALMATTIAGKRYVIDAKIQVTPDELARIEAELSQRPKMWGNTTRIERLEPA